MIFRIGLAGLERDRYRIKRKRTPYSVRRLYGKKEPAAKHGPGLKVENKPIIGVSWGRPHAGDEKAIAQNQEDFRRGG